MSLETLKEPTSNGSTGPRTPEGKAVSSLNALTDGFRCSRFIVPEGTESDFEFVVQRCYRAYLPVGDAEWLTFENVAHDSWNLHRIRTKLAALVSGADDPIDDPYCEKEYDRLDRYQGRYQSSLRSNLRELRQLQTNRVLQEALPEPLSQGTLPPLAKVSEIAALAKRTGKDFPGAAINTLVTNIRRNQEDREAKKGIRPLRWTDFLTDDEKEQVKK